MRSASAVIVLLTIAIAAGAVPASRSVPLGATTFSDSSYAMVGGQNGTWFGPGQAPRLEKIELANYSVTSLTPAPTEGTVWGGGWNGSQWLISGWGEDRGPDGSNPYIFLYNGLNQILGGSVDQYQAEATWHGGDIFAASSNGNDWLLSGLGSGELSSYGDSNHMSLSLFNGNNFTDLSSKVPHQRDFILYTNAWNGEYWLIAGGYQYNGALFSFDGNKIVDLTPKLVQAVPTFASVQSLAWNGRYWLIGGVGFLASYDGYTFTDLTSALNAVLAENLGCCSAVNTIAWDGTEWVLGGGTPIAQTSYSHAWLVKYIRGDFVDLTSELSPTARRVIPYSSVLSIAAADGLWIIGGYSNDHGWLYEFSGTSFKNLSYLVSNYTYVDWVGARLVRERPALIGRPDWLGSPESNIVVLSSEGQNGEALRLQRCWIKLF